MSEWRFLQGGAPVYPCSCVTCGSTQPLKLDCTAEGLNIVYAGDGTGLSNTSSGTVTFYCDRSVSVFFECYTVKDRLRIGQIGNLSQYYDSGCVTGQTTATITIPAGTTSFNLDVFDDCAFTGIPSAWYFIISG